MRLVTRSDHNSMTQLRKKARQHFFRNKSLGSKTNKQTEKKFLCLSQRLAQTFFEAKYLDFILKSLLRYKKSFYLKGSVTFDRVVI